MIRIARAEDTLQLSIMLYEMAHELMPKEASDENDKYWDEIFKYMRDDTYTIYIDVGKGFFMVKEEYEPIYPEVRRYIGTKVYIREHHRKGKLLKQFYDRLFEDFPDGDILGLTEIDSAHIPVLEKRHERIANVYKLKRS